jgi:oligopeptide/dipeptide ABC transporter ATP-binding protein
MTTTNDILLTVDDLQTCFRTEAGMLRAVDGVSFEIPRGQTFALVGESGCGKSVTALSILQLLPPAGTSNGIIRLGDDALNGLTDREMQSVRGGRIGMIFQEPMTSLNPVFTCGSQIVEAIRLHRDCSAREARKQAIDLLDQVGIADPAQRMTEYPHQLSGGMRQRVMIAMALSCEPELLIADEPTTALDVTIQAQILELLRKIQRERQLTLLLITHDLAVVAEMADSVGVMYAGTMVERADVKQLFANPLHPYTQGLFRSLVTMDETRDRLDTIPGSVPHLGALPVGCPFHPRCDKGQTDPRCATCRPDLREVAPDHHCACYVAPNYDTTEPKP